MSEYLRLDMYVNGHEFFIADAPVSFEGFEAILSASDAIDTNIASDIRNSGGARMSSDILTEKMVDVLWDITGKEITASDEITFCMCLWEGDEHIRSLVTEADCG